MQRWGKCNDEVSAEYQISIVGGAVVVQLVVHLQASSGFVRSLTRFRGLSQGIKCRELEMCPRPKIAGIPTKVCPLRQTFEPCDHGFGRYVTHKY